VNNIGAPPVCDERLAAGNAPPTVDLTRNRPYCRDIRTCVGLTDSETEDLLAGDGRHQVLALLLFGAELEHRRHGHVSLYGNRHCQSAGVTPGHLFGQDDIAEVVAPTAAVLLRVRQSEKAQLPHPLEYVVGETPFPLPFGRVRRELRFDERSDAGSQLIMLGRKRPLRHAGSVLAGKP
jgi:hypothetical protein